MTCIFCDILDGKRNGHVVYEDEEHIAFLDKYPIDDGHTLLIPKKHYERITDMNSAAVGKMFSLVPKIAKAILSGTGADAFSLAQNNGKAAKQIIPHVHIHIIPRYNSKGTVWTKRQIPTYDVLFQLSQKIKNTI
jgi:histidine triad (HIT) family protein